MLSRFLIIMLLRLLSRLLSRLSIIMLLRLLSRLFTRRYKMVHMKWYLLSSSMGLLPLLAFAIVTEATAHPCAEVERILAKLPF